MRRENGEGVEVDVAWIVLAVVVVLYLFTSTGCNGVDLARGAAASPAPTSSSPWITPTPTPVPPFKTVQVWGPALSDGCTGAGGNGDLWQPFVGDPDDPPTQGDARECLWYCAIDTAAGVTTPMQLDEVWDFDWPGEPPEEEVDPTTPPATGLLRILPGWPKTAPCGAP